MSNEIKLSILTFQINKKRKNEAIKLSELDCDFNEFFKEFILFFDNQYQSIKKSDKAIYLDVESCHIKSESEIIYGFMEAGKTGTKRKIKDKEKPTESLFEVLHNHVDSSESFYLLNFQKNSNIGIAIIQGLSTDSVTTVFKSLLTSFFKTKFNDYILNFNRLIPSEYINKIQDFGDISAVRLKSYKLPSDKANSTFGTSFTEGTVTVDITLKSNNQLKSLFNQSISNGKKFFSESFLDDFTTNQNAYDIEAEYKFNDKTVTARLSEGFNLAPTFYIKESDLDIDPETKGPTKVSIQNYCLSLFKDLRSKIDGNVRKN